MSVQNQSRLETPESRIFFGCESEFQPGRFDQARTTDIYIYMRNWLNSSCRSLLVRRSFFLKGAPNHGNRYGELPKAIPCNILKYN